MGLTGSGLPERSGIVSQIRAGDTEPIQASIVGWSGDPLTGKSDISVSIRRNSDGLTYDWDDAAWKAFSACVEPRRAMSEVDGANYPGEYSEVFTSPTGDDIYQVSVDQVPRTDAANVPQSGEIRAGQWAGTIEFTRKILNNRQELSNGATGNMVTYDDDDTTVLVTSDATDYTGNPISLAPTAPARRSRGV